MCHVHISIILEGLEYCILGRKAFAKVTQKPGRLSSYVIHFDVPSILQVHLPWVDVHSAICETYSM